MTNLTILAIHAITDTTRLELFIGHLAAQWRGAFSQQHAVQTHEIEQVYHEAIRHLFALGYNAPGGLDADAELPDSHMPQIYRDRYPTLG